MEITIDIIGGKSETAGYKIRMIDPYTRHGHFF